MGLNPSRFMQHLRQDLIRVLPRLDFLFTNWQLFITEYRDASETIMEDLLKLIEPSLFEFFRSLHKPYLLSSTMHVTTFNSKAKVSLKRFVDAQVIDMMVRDLDRSLMTAFRAIRQSFGDSGVVNRFVNNHFVTYVDEGSLQQVLLKVPFSPRTRQWTHLDFPSDLFFEHGLTSDDQIRLIIEKCITMDFDPRLRDELLAADSRTYADNVDPLSLMQVAVLPKPGGLRDVFTVPLEDTSHRFLHRTSWNNASRARNSSTWRAHTAEAHHLETIAPCASANAPSERDIDKIVVYDDGIEYVSLDRFGRPVVRSLVEALPPGETTTVSPIECVDRVVTALLLRLLAPHLFF